MFNKLKKYPELLVLADLNEFDRTKSLRAIFDRDIIENDKFIFNNKQIYPVKTDEKFDLDRVFRHLITVDEDDKSKQREYDSYRSERLHWIRTHIDKNVMDSELTFFCADYRDRSKRVTLVRTYIYNKKRKYVVVLEPQRNNTAYYLLTAYYLNKKQGIKQIEANLKKRLPYLI